jgi:hypothetical protein
MTPLVLAAASSGGVAVLCLTVAMLAPRRGRKSAQAKGAVVRLDMEKTGDGETWLPTARFTTPDGRSFEVKGYWSYHFKDAVVGTPIAIMYDPGNPNDAGFADDKRAVIGPILLAVGVMFLLAAGGLGAAAYFSAYAP